MKPREWKHYWRQAEGSDRLIALEVEGPQVGDKEIVISREVPPDSITITRKELRKTIDKSFQCEPFELDYLMDRIFASTAIAPGGES